MKCIFCAIAEGRTKADIVYQDEDVVGFRDLTPQAPHHVLVIPRRHIATINECGADDEALLGRLMLAAQRIARQLGVADDGYRLVMNCNRDGGQSVWHIHLHLLAGRAMGWPPG